MSKANAQLRTQIQALQNDASDNGRGVRGVTPENSAFGGTTFTSTGFAAWDAFKPYGEDQKAENVAFDKSIRKAGVKPGVFEGDKTQLDQWIIMEAVIFEEDDPTYKTARSRMAVVNSLMEGPANELLEGRYRSKVHPFSGVAEMVATLATAYHDDIQASKSRNELRKMQYKPGDPAMDIHQFIDKINSLADRANVSLTDRKMTFYEHIPADLDTRLLTEAKDPFVP